VRVISGALGGRQFDSPGTRRTHPMSDKMRGALFNILGELGGLTVLDAFGGSGALSFEAVSRGASEVTVMDSDRAAQATIGRNIRNLTLQDSVRLVKAPALSWLGTNPEAKFNIILCDPPYDDLQPQTLEALATRLQPAGVFVLSYPASEELPHFEGLSLVKQQHYGDAQLGFYLAGE
jgi:16S rRNA (guanine966-N2)-methyltransferase